jgi:hypothetical protein
MNMLDAFSRRFERLRRQVRAVSRAAKAARDQTDQALRALGMDTRRDPTPVIDVAVERGSPVAKAARAAARGLLHSAAIATAAVLLGIALLSLGMFAGAAVLAFVVVTRGLGLHIDLRTPRPA